LSEIGIFKDGVFVCKQRYYVHHSKGHENRKVFFEAKNELGREWSDWVF